MSSRWEHVTQYQDWRTSARPGQPPANGSLSAANGAHLWQGKAPEKAITQFWFIMKQRQSDCENVCVCRHSCKTNNLTFNLSLGPYQQLHAWRMLGSVRTNSLRSVTVLWKVTPDEKANNILSGWCWKVNPKVMDGFLPQPPSPEDFSGELQHYKIFWGSDQKQEVTCHAALSQCLVEVPAEVQALSVSAITSYGASPPAEVSLRHSGTQNTAQHV